MAKRWYYKDENGNKVPVPQYKINADDYYTKAMSDSRYYDKSATDTMLATKVDKTDIVQSTGTSTTSVMSQKAVSDAIADERTRANGVEENLDNKVTGLEARMIYDVSANNGGEVFESISTLLNNSDLDTLIPISVRHGGMSIRFVQSSDNKYVQYRYMGTETTGSPNPLLDTTNWINTEDEIEGLETRVDVVEQELYGWNADFTKNVELGTINQNTGKWLIDGDGYTHVAIAIDSDSVSKINIKSKETTAVRYIFLKSYSAPQNNDNIDFCDGFNTWVFISPNTLVEDIVVPHDAQYICFLLKYSSVYNTPEYAKSTDSIKNDINQLSAKVSDTSNSLKELQGQFNDIDKIVEEGTKKAIQEKVEIDFSTNDGYYLISNTGKLNTASSYTTSDFISVKEGYKIEYDGLTVGEASACWGYDVANENTENKSKLLGNVTGKASVIIPSGVNYIRVSGRKIAIGTETAINYSAFYLTNKYVTNELLENSVSSVKHEMDTYQFGELNLKFDFSNMLPNYTFPQRLSTCEQLYQLWDDLVSANTAYITKVDASTETGIAKPAYVTTPVYVYKFIPKVDNTNTTRKLKVFLYSGEHSNEWAGLYFLKDFMKWICDNWRTDGNCEILRTMVDFYVIPCLNVWGYDNMVNIPNAGRFNYNGVNINRNYPASNWKLTEQGLDYSGPSAGSEYETQVIMWYIKNIKPDIMLSVHTGGTNINGNVNTIDISINDKKQNIEDFKKLFGIICRTSANRMTIDDSNYPQSLDQVLINYDIYKESDIVAGKTDPYTGICHMYAMEEGVPISMLVEMCNNSLWENGIKVENGGEEGTNLLGMCQMRYLSNLICRSIHAISKSAYR